MSEYWQKEENPHISRTHWAQGWEKDADYELSEENSLQEIRIISSRLAKNNFLTYGILQALLGITLGGNITIKVEYPSETVRAQLNELLTEFLSGVDIENEVPIEEFLEMITLGALEKGDILINPIEDEDKVSGFSLELVEAGRILTPNEFVNDVNVVEGVVYKDGKVKSFWVRNLCRSLNSLSGLDYSKDNFVELPKYRDVLYQGKVIKKRLCYLFRSASDRRPNQTRGKPIATPIMGLLRYIAQYFEALLISMRISACFCGIMTTKNVPGTVENLNKTKIENFFQTLDIPPGTILVTEEGNVAFSNPPRPSDNVEGLLKFFCLLLGMAMRVPYPILFLDMKDVNYSSYRGAAMEVKQMVKRWHNRYCWLLNWLVWEALKNFKIKNLLKFSLNQCKIVLNFPEFEALDPEKTSRGDRLDIENSTTSPQHICERKGVDYDQIMEENKRHAVTETVIQAEVLKTQKEYEALYKIIFPTTIKESNDDESKRERRVEDGNF